MSDATETPRPLDGIVVIDIGQLIAAPLVGQMLGDLGATVIKVENRGKGDLSRFIVEPIYRNPDGDPIGESVLSFAMNRNKRSIEVDISTEDGQGIIRALADKADVLIQNLRVGTMERFGLGWDNLKESNPALIMCSISGYGQTGPYARRSAKDSSLQAMSGLMSLTGQAEGEPQKVGYPVADVNAGLYATIAILAALRGRDTQGGRGQHIDISLLDCQIAALGHRILSYFVSGRVPLRNGNVPPGTSMARTIQCRDAWITISADADNEFPVFCRVLGRPELAADPRFSDQAGRSRNIDALLAEIEPIMRSRDAAAWDRRPVRGAHHLFPDLYHRPDARGSAGRRTRACADRRSSGARRNPHHRQPDPNVRNQAGSPHRSAALGKFDRRCASGLSRSLP